MLFFTQPSEALSAAASMGCALPHYSMGAIHITVHSAVDPQVYVP